MTFFIHIIIVTVISQLFFILIDDMLVYWESKCYIQSVQITILNSKHTILCNVWQGHPRSLVPSTMRHDIFNKLRLLSHLASRRYVTWQMNGMSAQYETTHSKLDPGLLRLPTIQDSATCQGSDPALALTVFMLISLVLCRLQNATLTCSHASISIQLFQLTLSDESLKPRPQSSLGVG